MQIKLEHLTKRFGDTVAVNDLSITLESGKLIALLGPSGCGKTTTLNMISGILPVSGGSIFFDDRDVTSLPPEKRGIGLVFQNYALYPHMTVLQNICFPMEIQRIPKKERIRRAEELAEMVHITPYLKRKPAELSGGQQQRVALARMLAARPGILMLDEPFSALDSHLKGVLEQNLVSLFDAFEGTILYVSHDIDESLRFCDRIAVVDAGRIVEMDRGRELVNRPQSVAGLKLSGCKNAPAAVYAGPHAVHVPPWGIDVHTAQEVPRDVKCLGLRAFYVERAEGPGENCYRVRVDRVSDARFERMALLGFLDRDDADGAAVAFEANEMSYLHQHMFWRVSMREGVALPEVGEKLWVRIPPDKVYLVSR